MTVTAVQLPLTSFDADVAAVRRAIALAEGDVVLVGTYAGAVIGEAGNDPKVQRLVSIDAFAPDAGESAGSLFAQFQAAPLGAKIAPIPKASWRCRTKGSLRCSRRISTRPKRRWSMRRRGRSTAPPWEARSPRPHGAAGRPSI